MGSKSKRIGAHPRCRLGSDGGLIFISTREEDDMIIENAINPVSSVFLRNDSNRFHPNRETFHDIFQRKLNSQSGSRPPKIELTGILIPCRKLVQGSECHFQLETDSQEYFLTMKDSLLLVAKRLEWEEVTVKGFLNPADGSVEVEKVSLAGKNEAFRLGVGSMDSYFELDQYKRIIAQRGKLDLAPDDPAA
jgi:hypothetical protein